jgi:hypothetical protein
MSHPIVTVNIAIEPSSVTLGEPCSIILSTTLSYPSQILIHTWPSVFNLRLSQRRKNFFCIDISNNDEPVFLALTKGGKRSGYIGRMLGGVHDQYLRTLYPGNSVVFTAPFLLATRLDGPLVAGHRYRFGFSEGESIKDWMHGTREEVMTPPGVNAPFDKGSRKIILDLGPPIEFEVLESSSEMQSPTLVLGKTHERPLEGIKPSLPPSPAYPTQSPAMILTWISFIASGGLVFYVWTDACFYGIPKSIAAFLPGPLAILAIFWLHVIPVALIAHGDGKISRAVRPLQVASWKRCQSGRGHK